MPKQEGQKSKLLALLRIFEQQTDENHLLNVPQLVELLEAQGIRCERKSVYSDIEALGALGYDIKLRRGRGGGYFLASRTFDLAELKLLVDAVQASRVVSGTPSRRHPRHRRRRRADERGRLRRRNKGCADSRYVLGRKPASANPACAGTAAGLSHQHF